MTRSIFDPGNPDVERSGDTFTGPDAGNKSHLPSSAVDGLDAGPNRGPDTVEFDGTGQPIEPPPAVEGQGGSEPDLGQGQG